MTEVSFGSLTPRQRQCLRHVYLHHPSKVIAAELGLSKGTVDVYLSDATRLLGARNRSHAAVMFAAYEASSSGANIVKECDNIQFEHCSSQNIDQDFSFHGRSQDSTINVKSNFYSNDTPSLPQLELFVPTDLSVITAVQRRLSNALNCIRNIAVLQIFVVIELAALACASDGLSMIKTFAIVFNNSDYHVLHLFAGREGGRPCIVFYFDHRRGPQPILRFPLQPSRY